MTVERASFAVAGLLVLLSLALGYFVSPYWLLLAAFVGLGLFRAAFADRCPAMNVLRAVCPRLHGTSGH